MEKKWALALVLINLFIAFLGIGLVIPVMPTIMNELDISGTVVGYMVAAFAIAQLIFSPLAGKWADHFGRKKMIVIGLFIFSLSEFMFAIGTDVSLLFVSRILGGMSAAFIMPAVTAFIADITTIEARPKALGFMSAAITTGFIVGPGIGGFLAAFGTRTPFYAATCLALFAAILSLITLKEPEKQQLSANDKVQQQPSWRKMFHQKYFVPLLIIFISTFGLAAFDSFFSLFTTAKFDFTETDIAISITGGAIVGAIAQVILFSALTKKLGELKLVLYCMIVSAVLVLGMTVMPTHGTVLAITFIVFVGFDLIRPALTSYLSKVAGPEQGFVGGMNSMFTSLGNIFAPIIGGMLFDVNINYPFIFATMVLVGGILLMLAWRAPRVQEEAEETIVSKPAYEE